MANSKSKLSKEELNAMKVQAMLSGKSIDDLMSEMEEMEEDDFDIEIEDEKPKKKKRNSSKKQPIGSEKQVFTTGVHNVPELDKFKRLNRNLKMNVAYRGHDIPYKEQLWPVPDRTISYDLELVKSTKKSKDIAELMSKGSIQEKQKAENGETRYYRLFTNDESVLHQIREIAYLKVAYEDGKYKIFMHVKSKLIKDNNGNPDNVRNRLIKLSKEVVMKQNRSIS